MDVNLVPEPNNSCAVCAIASSIRRWLPWTTCCLADRRPCTASSWEYLNRVSMTGIEAEQARTDDSIDDGMSHMDAPWREFASETLAEGPHPKLADCKAR